MLEFALGISLALNFIVIITLYLLFKFKDEIKTFIKIKNNTKKEVVLDEAQYQDFYNSSNFDIRK